MSYTNRLFAICEDGQEDAGDALARGVWFLGIGRAFGGEFGLPLRALGSSSQQTIAWAHQSVVQDDTKAALEQFATDGPYPLLNNLGVNNANIAAAKTAVTVECYPRSTHEHGFVAWLASKGYEVMA